MMKTDDWQKIKAAFNAAIDLPEAERAAVLTNCDAHLREDVAKLLKAHAAADEFIAEPAMVEIGLSDETDANIGRRIDDYEILSEIGQGGMGAVYLAKHLGESFTQNVAVKLIKRGMDTAAVLKRFVMERQILANLEHPNIARLLDVGTTEDGLPYFVMEYIEGLPVTKFCDARKFSVEERLKLFRQICAAVQYAHQNLVVHRDIKPSNILVTKDETPKLLDFGIAKILNPDWSVETAEATATMMRLLTPEYASPEQLRGANITTASDVYSLGVVLYELLSGRRPFIIENDSREEFIQAILTKEPVRPSAVGSRAKRSAVGSQITNQDDASITDDSQRHANPKSQIPNPKSLKGDLDNIILKALRKEPERRYASVQEFSEDIRRHLIGLPVTATADTVSYRIGKFIKRHRAGVLAGGLFVLTLLAATAITTRQSIVARREQAKAEQRFNQVRKLANTVLFEYHDGIAKLAGSTPMREKMVKDALEYLDNLSAENSSDADLQRELAAAYQKVGDVQGGSSQSNLGNREDAIVSYRKSLAILESLPSAGQNNSLLVEIAAVHGKLHQVLWNMSRQEEAEEHAYQALEIREKLVASEPENLIYRVALARSYRDFGGLLASKTNKDGAGAVAYYRKSNELCEAIIKTDPSNLEARAIAGLGYRRLGAEFELTEPQTALEYYQKALALTLEREKLDSQNAQIQIVLADCYSNIGRALMMQKNESGASENFRRAMEIFKTRLELDPNDALTKTSISQNYNNVGNLMAQSGKFPEALENYKQSLDMREIYVKEHPNESGMHGRLGETTFDLGDLYAKMATVNGTSANNKIMYWREAKSWYQRSLEVWQTLSKNGTLQGYQAAKPDETLQAISKCDESLAQMALK
jgi:eukaryotic-like serine/threonine-protein kinase